MRWIPVTERLPNESGSYLVTVPMDNGDSYVDALDYHKGKFYEYDSEWGDIEYDDVLAWMPLPEPYKADCKTEPNLSEIPNSSTISKMEQVDKDINVRSKDEPQTEDADCDKCIWSVCNYNKAFAFEDEPQADCDGCQHYADKHTADACYECKRSYTDGYEPQAERSE